MPELPPDTEDVVRRALEEDVGAGDVTTDATVPHDIDGHARPILTGERVALNFLTHLSGIATLTRAYVDACIGTESTILCTRKTIPGLRALERYAVEVGGGAL